jgi:hypothetical protein
MTIELEDVIPQEDSLVLNQMTDSASRPALSKNFNKGYMSYRNGGSSSRILDGTKKD